jgi:hypothetical protein
MKRKLCAATCLLLMPLLCFGQELKLNPKDWTFTGDTPITAYAANGAVAFDFPVDDATHPRVDYFWSDHHRSMSGVVTATFQVVTSNPAVRFNWKLDDDNTCSTTAHVRLILARNDWDKKNNPDLANTRWWSNPIAYELVGGSAIQLQVPLTPDQWSNIDGQFGTAGANTVSGFAEALKHPGMLGLSFGGGCFFGHGVNVSGGKAQFLLWGLSSGS